MLLQGEQLKRYRDEIAVLHRQAFGEEIKSASFFGVFDGDQLAAAAALKNYMGHWYMRGCVVKPEYRGRGFQRQLLKERLAHLAGKAKIVRVTVLPDNIYSINNLVAEGFAYDNKTKIINKKLHHVYKRDLG